MTTSESFRALRRANPRNREDFAALVEATGQLVQARLVAGAPPTPPAARRGLVRISAGAAFAVAVAAVTLFARGLSGRGRGAPNPSAPIQKSAAVNAA